MIYLFTAIGLTLGGSSTVHTYTQNNTINNKNYTVNNGTTQLTTRSTQLIHANLEECRPYPVFASYTLAFAIQLRKKHR